MSPMMAIIAAAAARRASGGTDADVQDFFDRVTANSGTLSSGTQTAVATFVAAAKGHGYWSKLSRINLLCGDQLAAAMVPLKDAGDSPLDTPTGADSGDYSEALGLVGDGSLYVDTNYTPTTQEDDPASFGLFLYLGGTPLTTKGSTQVFLGATVSGSNTEIVWALSLNGVKGFIAGSANGCVGVATNGSRAGQFYFNGSPIGSTGTTSDSFGNRSLILLARDTDGTIGFKAVRDARAYAITTGMSAAEVADFADDLNAFQTSLGRNVY
jgi:hypothetical protein